MDMDIDLIVFDMAGTTVMDDDAVHRQLQAALAQVGVTASRHDVNAVMGMPKPHAIQALLTQHQGRTPSGDAVASVHASFMDRMIRYYRDDSGVRECEGATDVLRWCRRHGVKTSLDTGFNRAIADAIIQRLGWSEAGLLDATVASDEVPRGRPHPDMIFRLMELTLVPDSARVAKVGDTPVDIAQGRAAGCGLVVAVTSGSHSAAELQPHGPTHLIETLSGLYAILERSTAGAA
ncbi:MAG TPA: HAD family hydrolase [Vicinamibacterales bacterium]|nr:HAD family hydrolase [Vicinamibacterales bacterium]